MGKVWSRICCLLLCLLLLAGCWDRRELEERISVVGIAIDFAKGNEDLYKITIQVPIPLKIAGSTGKGGGGSADAVRIMSVTGRTIKEATNNIQQRLNQRIFFGHTRVLAISESVARRGTKEIIDSFRRDPQIRRLLWPIVVKGEAAALLEIKPRLVQIPVVYIMEMIENGRRIGLIPNQTMGDFYIQTTSDAMEAMLNYVEVKDDEASWKGVAIFRGYKMVGNLNEIQTWSLLQLRDRKRGGDVVIRLPGTKHGYVTFRPHFVRTKLDMQGGLLGETDKYRGHAASYHCVVQGDIIEMTSKPDVPKEKMIAMLQDLIKKEMENRAKKLFHQLQDEHNSDVLKLGLALHAHHYFDYWVEHKWLEDFKDFPIKATYTIKLRRLGMEMY
ncbi:Ger(x)C family spore germination protein [Brevibacillus ruminantium]|uniref:Ger(X)C family spore germination protein n=1 Tax=Brevibacillus ruminantium TaxID=2950604 RepID=A0ABY4WAS6_9BACL|nr:Ger(x)C family spore germination protein [Brevibacillus ruminantium]USG64281.1 Ger(x)C family spore germination protein [Brevibacillus ruminantium]